jgi:hypothetical protein
LKNFIQYIKENKEELKVGDCFIYFIQNFDTNVPVRFHNKKCIISDIRLYDYSRVDFQGWNGRGWWVKNSELVTEEEFKNILERRKKLKRKNKDIDPYGEEDWGID